MSFGVGHRCGLDLTCCGCGTGRPAVAPIQPLAWELPYATGVGLKRQKKKKKKLPILADGVFFLIDTFITTSLSKDPCSPIISLHVPSSLQEILRPNICVTYPTSLSGTVSDSPIPSIPQPHCPFAFQKTTICPGDKLQFDFNLIN